MILYGNSRDYFRAVKNDEGYMFNSMTGFARVEESNGQGNISWELRSVNHRYLEVNFRLPEEVRRLEPQLRKYLQSQLSRGKVDCTLRYKLTESETASLELNELLLTSVLQQIDVINEKISNPAAIQATDVMAWPGVVSTAEIDMQTFHANCMTLFKNAMQQLTDMRASEGQRLQEMLLDRCAEVEAIVNKVRLRLPQVLQGVKDKLLQRIEELGVEVDQNRLEQELVYLAQKMDVAEELDRLESHLKEMASIFERKDPVGRRLDFIMQEFHREANTLGSKSADFETTQASVDLKVLIEQMREQVQNIE